MDEKLMLKVASTIRAANRFDMDYDYINFKLPNRELAVTADDLLYNCDAVGCVAGWTMATLGLSPTQGLVQAENYLRLEGHEALQLFYADRASIWHVEADTYGWETDMTGVVNWKDITAFQVADVLERLATGDIEFLDEDAYSEAIGPRQRRLLSGLVTSCDSP